MVSRGCEVVRLWGQGRPITRPTLCTGLSQYLTISTGAGGNFKPGSRKQREGSLGHSFVKWNDIRRGGKYVTCDMCRFRMVKIWIPQNTFFSWFFTGRAFIMVYYIIKLVLEFQFDLQNPLKQPKMWIFEKWKIIVFGQNHGIFWPKGDLKPCIIMYLGNIHNMSLVPVTFRHFFQILQKWHFFG